MRNDGGKDTVCDVAVAGAGPAGLTAAIAAAGRGLSVTVIEKNDMPGKKLLITGKGRCNVTNDCGVPEFLQNVRSGERFLYSSLTAFGPAQTMEFFEDAGVPLKTERGNRVFPVSDRAADIRDALVRAAKQAGCAFVTGRAAGIETRDGAVCALSLADGRRISCRALILATGGLSYPKTGSTGDGYALAQAAGHTVTPPRPSLVPLVCAGGDCAALQGLSLRNVKLTARAGDKTIFSEQGELLFTHYGVSGPLVLTLSARMVGADTRTAALSVDLKPALDEKTLDRRLQRDFSAQLNREFKNSLGALLPKKLIPVVVARSGIDPQKKLNALTAAERLSLARLIKDFRLEATDMRSFDEAVVTAGGVALPEVSPKTMESKRIRNLHFAGELLDADAFTGGFNLGIAFATGHAAGMHVLEGEDCRE
ncbi:MAG: NAD(P)/FAD-dependent oxidoreductase [Oscillospiraceae bacterium]|nr:NAD(P)/FAD-dependent oxidoreductase [Oscillospiraceae bacterium]